MELQYCITHEQIVSIDVASHLVIYPHRVIEHDEYDWCFGPFANCPPPTTDDIYWEWLFLQEPDEEFMEISNQGLMYSG